MTRMESLWCNTIIENSVTGQRLCSLTRSLIFITVTPTDNSLIIVRKRTVRQRYELKELVGICTDDAFPDRVALKFKSHNHNVVLLYDIHDQIRNILSFIHEYIALSNQEHIINKEYKIDMGSYSCMKRYTIKYDYDILTNLVLENVNLRCLVGLENKPHLQTVSLSGSELGKTRIEKETFWNWMSLKNVGKSVTTLLMDNVDLKVVPFEMQYLTKLETLSMAHNKLVIFIYFNMLILNL